MIPRSPNASAASPSRPIGSAISSPRSASTVEADWTVLPPPARRDIDGPADLVEEIIRIVGIDSVPTTPLPRTPGVAKPTATPAQTLESRVRRAAAARGLNEAITWSFLSDAQASAIGGGAWSLANPISEDLKVMRPSLLPGLFAAAERNMKRGAPGVRLFEIGRRYLAEGERATLGVVLAGENALARLAGGQGQRLRRVRCQGRGAGAAWQRQGHRSRTCKSWATQARPGIPANRARSGSGPRPCWRRSAWSTR